MPCLARAVTEAKIWFDGACQGNPGKAGAGAIVEIDGRKEKLSKFLGRGTNNEAEYQGLILGLRFAKAQGAGRVQVFGDSQLIVRQLDGRYRVKAGNLKGLHREAKALLDGFEAAEVTWLAREGNEEADQAARDALG